MAPGPGVAFLAGGHPDTSIFGVETLRGMASAVVGDGATALQYGLTDGTEAMRETAAGLGGRRMARCGAWRCRTASAGPPSAPLPA